jgi:hypothetical protein
MEKNTAALVQDSRIKITKRIIASQPIVVVTTKARTRLTSLFCRLSQTPYKPN